MLTKLELTKRLNRRKNKLSRNTYSIEVDKKLRSCREDYDYGVNEVLMPTIKVAELRN